MCLKFMNDGEIEEFTQALKGQCFPCSSAGKESTCNAGNPGSIPVLVRSPGKGNKLPPPVLWPGEFHGLSMELHRVGHN